VIDFTDNLGAHYTEHSSTVRLAGRYAANTPSLPNDPCADTHAPPVRVVKGHACKRREVGRHRCRDVVALSAHRVEAVAVRLLTHTKVLLRCEIGEHQLRRGDRRAPSRQLDRESRLKRVGPSLVYTRMTHAYESPGRTACGEEYRRSA